MIDDVRLALTALRSEGVPDDDSVSVLALSGIPGCFMGIDHLGRPHLLLEAVSGSQAEASQDIATLEVGIRPLKVGNTTLPYLDVTCLFESVAEVFEHFCVAVLDRVNDEERADVALATVLDKWRQFLTPPVAPPGKNKLAEILGELLVLSDLASLKPIPALNAWLGPEKARHDFRSGEVALEVKTTQAHTGRRVTIHGEDQLVAPKGGELYLHLVRLEHASQAGRSVASVVDDLLSAGVPADGLFKSLAAAGLPVADLASTADVEFEVRERLTILVDEDTPRITPQSFSLGERPAGIVDLSYVIDLDHVLDRALTTGQYRKALDRFFLDR